MACELPAERGVPLSRWSSAELAVEAVPRGIVAKIAAVTIWRWLHEDAIRPWNYRSWIFPRDPQFARRPAGSSTSTRAAGRENCWTRATSWCAVMRSRRSRRARGCIPASPRSPAVTGSWSSTSTSARARSATSQRGTSVARAVRSL